MNHCKFCLSPPDFDQSDSVEQVFHCGNSYFRDEPDEFHRGDECRTGELAIKRAVALWSV